MCRSSRFIGSCGGCPPPLCSPEDSDECEDCVETLPDVGDHIGVGVLTGSTALLLYDGVL